MKLSVFFNTRRVLIVCGTLGATLLVGACGGGADATGPSGQSIALRTVPELAGANCATGGTKIEAGPDGNANGLLEDREVNSTAYVCNGQSGLAGVAGVAGIGTVGATGPAGAGGAVGPAGAVGPVGAPGAAGPAGPAGAPGATGAAGVAGVAGATGPAGAAGLAGATGAPGATGPAGATGTTGLIGPSGPQGATGTAGVNGATGPAGATGTVGPIGATGPSGPVGATGTAGLDGATGPAGATGTIGPIGATGPAGPPGPGTVIESCSIGARTAVIAALCTNLTTGISVLIQAGPDNGSGVPSAITSAVLICGTGSTAGSVSNPVLPIPPSTVPVRVTCSNIR
jgi:collagen type I alpha